MKVNIRLFAIMSQYAQTGHLSLDIPDGSTVAAVREELARRFPTMPWPPGTLLAVNQEYAGERTPLSGGDEIAVIPPVSGG